jgi:hypothetical protein
VSFVSSGGKGRTLVSAYERSPAQLDVVGRVRRTRARADASPLTWNIKFAVTLLKPDGTDPDVVESP